MIRTALALSLIGLGAVSALPAQTVEERQIIGGGGGAVWGPSDPSAPCQPGAPAGGSSWAPCFFPPKTGGLNPPKEKREDAHVEERQFFLPADAHSNPKKFIAEQQKRLEQLQNKRDKTPQDLEDINNIRRALRYLADITNISAPPGSSSTFTPGKRDEITIGSAGPFSSVCPNTQGLEDVLRAILDKRRLSHDDIMIIQQIQNFLTACGGSISDGTGTFTPWGGNDKRDITPETGLEAAFKELVQSLGDGGASLDTWLLLQSFADIAENQGASIDRSVSLGSASIVPRQMTIGDGTCGQAILKWYQLSLAAITAVYPNPARAPAEVRAYAQTLALLIQACGLKVDGWPTTTLTPGNTVPGGSMIPGTTVPGGSMNPDPYQSGGSISPQPTIPGGSFLPPTTTISGGSIYPQPTNGGGGSIIGDPWKSGGSLNPRGQISGDSETLLSALHTLEAQYGTYQSGKIPSSVFYIMAFLVQSLQNQGVVVMGWPSSTFGVSN